MAEKEIRFTKIKYDGTKVRIEYEVTKGTDAEPDEYTLFSADKPRPELEVALGALTVDVVDICEFEPHYAAQIDVRGVTVTWTNDIMGACVTALKRLTTANAPLVVNTPHLPESPYGEGNPNEPVMPAGMAERLRALFVEAHKYMDGERAQGSLFADTTAAVA